jgi:hypothetical protein
LGTSRDVAYAFLEDNLRRSSDLSLNASPPPNWQPLGYSTISADLWVRYVFFFGQYKTVAAYVFDDNDSLVELTVLEADAFW